MKMKSSYSDYGCKKYLNSDHITQIIHFRDILKKNYGDDFDMKLQLEIKNNNILLGRLDVIIHYPEITITNSSSRRNKHTIKDLFVRICFYLHKNKIYPARGIAGLRTTIAPEEYYKHYAHSHLGSTRHSNPAFGGFCLGDSELLNMFTMYGSQKSIDLNEFQLLLYTIDNYVKWESREGGPHIRMSGLHGISTISYNDITIDQCETYGNNLNSKHGTWVKEGNNHLIPKLNFKFKDGKYHVVDDMQFDDYLKHKGTMVQTYFNYEVCIKDDNGTYYKVNNGNSTISITNPPKWSFSFRDKEFHFQIDFKSKVNVMEFHIHPKIKQYVKQQIERRINAEFIEDQIRTHVASL